MVFTGCEESVFRNNVLVNPIMKTMEIFGERWGTNVGKPPRHIFIEDNHFKYTGDYTVAGSSSVAATCSGEYIVIRHNMITDCQSGLLFAGAVGSDGKESEYGRYYRVYNNVIYNMGHGHAFKYNGFAMVFGGDGNNDWGHHVIVNNIMYRSLHTDGRWFVGFPATTLVGFQSATGPEDIYLYNNDIAAYGADNASVFADIHDGNYRAMTVASYQGLFPTRSGSNLSLNPMFVDADNFDYHIASPSSPVIDAGKPLTQTSSAGSGNVVTVEDASYFTDGFGIVDPDQIQIGSNVVTISAVDYATNQVTLASSTSWSAGDPVSLPWSGAAPDMGIYEYAPTSPTVTGRYVFYNNSSFDGYGYAANAADDAAIATDKSALLPGHTATFANYTSYSAGINGIMIDISNLPGTPTVSDFAFKAGNDSTPSGWSTAIAPSAITVRRGAGVGGSDRVTITWDDNDIQKKWLQVTVLATANTGLSSPDVFYFGNAIGETGNSTSDAMVTPADEVLVRNNVHTLGVDPASITDACDINRDGKVGPADQILCRNNGTNGSTALQLIAP